MIPTIKTSYLSYDQVDFNKVIGSRANKKEIKDKEGKTIIYHLVPIFYKKDDGKTSEFIFRLPECDYLPLTNEYKSMALAHDQNDANYEAIKAFFAKLHERGAQFLFDNSDKLSQDVENVTQAKSHLNNPIHVKKLEGGARLGSGITYLRLLGGSPTTNGTLFAAPGKRKEIIPKFKLYGCRIRASVLVRVSSIFIGAKNTIRMEAVEVNIKNIKKLNSESVDPEYTYDDPQDEENFYKELNASVEQPENIETSDADAKQFVDGMRDMEKFDKPDSPPLE